MAEQDGSRGRIGFKKLERSADGGAIANKTTNCHPRQRGMEGGAQNQTPAVSILALLLRRSPNYRAATNFLTGTANEVQSS